NDTPLQTTDETARRVETVIREVADRHGREHPGKDGRPRQILRSLTTFVGGGGPRFWFSVSPELQQLNYAQVIVEVTAKEATRGPGGDFQPALPTRLPGARVDVRQLQTNPVDMPIEIRLAAQADVGTGQEGQDIQALRLLAARVQEVFRGVPQ